MRLFGKSVYPKSGYAFHGIITLTKDACVVQMKNGRLQWRAFGVIERNPDDKKQTTAIGITTKFDEELAKKLTDWPKGTRLLVDGYMERNDYLSQRNGKDEYILVAEFIHDQHDYAAAEAGIKNHSTAEVRNPSTDDDDQFVTVYDPVF